MSSNYGENRTDKPSSQYQSSSDRGRGGYSRGTNLRGGSAQGYRGNRGGSRGNRGGSDYHGEGRKYPSNRNYKAD